MCVLLGWKRSDEEEEEDDGGGVPPIMHGWVGNVSRRGGAAAESTKRVGADSRRDGGSGYEAAELGYDSRRQKSRESGCCPGRPMDEKRLIALRGISAAPFMLLH